MSNKSLSCRYQVLNDTAVISDQNIYSDQYTDVLPPFKITCSTSSDDKF